MKITPWNIHEKNSNIYASQHRFSLKYENFQEIAMGGPLIGNCHIFKEKTSLFSIHGCGCPAIWSDSGKLCALPLWRGTYQTIGIIDPVKKQMQILDISSPLIKLLSFKKNILRGIHNPLSNTIPFEIEISNIPILNIIKL